MSRDQRVFVPFDSQGDFRPTEGAVHRLAARGVGATVLSSCITLGIQLSATVVLARLLTPADFGLVAMATTFSLLLTNFGLNGFTEAILQRERLTHQLASNLFWINLASGALLGVGFAAAGGQLARFYHEQEVSKVCAGLSLAIVSSSTSVFHIALLKRAMRFGVASATDIVARLVSVSVSIAFGVLGWGYWALVAGAIALPLSQSLGAWYFCRWVPGIPRRTPGTGSMIQFAITVYGRFGFNYIVRNSDNLLVGWRFGAYSLGFYKRAYDLFALPVSQIMSPLINVGVSALTRVRHDANRFQRYIFAAIALSAFVGMGLGANLTLTGSDLILVLLGAKWGETGRIFRYFGPGIGVMLVYCVGSCIHLSIGRPERWLRWSIVESLFTGVLFVLALPWGPAGIALAWTISIWVLIVPGYWYAIQPLGARVAPFVAPIWRFVVASLISAVASSVLVYGGARLASYAGVTGALVRILVASTLFWIFYVGAVMLMHRRTENWADVVALARAACPQISWLGSARTESVHEIGE